MCVGFGRQRELALADEARNLGPRAPLSMQERDSAMAQVLTFSEAIFNALRELEPKLEVAA